MAQIEEYYLTDVKFLIDYEKEESGGDLIKISGVENVRQALLRRWFTVRGTLIHRPEYGAGVKSYQNSIGTLSTRRKLALDIQEQSLRDPRVEEVIGVAFSSEDGTPEKTIISVRVKLVGYGEVTIASQPLGDI